MGITIKGRENEGKAILENNIETLKLRELYQIHTDVVQELIKKKEIFSREYIEALRNKFPNIINSQN